jgi:hypothetical protein
MVELDFGGARDVDELRNRGIWSGGLRPSGNRGVEEGEPDTYERPAQRLLFWGSWRAVADARYFASWSSLEMRLDTPAGCSCISLKMGSSFSFIILYFLYSSTSCCESAVRPISR